MPGRFHRDGEIAALRRALEINPNYSPAARQLAAVYERGGEFTESAAILEKAVVRDPLNGANHGSLADTLWRLGRKGCGHDAHPPGGPAGAGVRLGVVVPPPVGRRHGEPKAAEEMARELTVRGPANRARGSCWREPRSTGWARTVHEERLAAVARA